MTEQTAPGEIKSHQSKRDYFEQLAFSRLPEMRLLFRGGKLWKKDRWRNVAEHCLVQIAVADTLSSLLGLPSNEKVDLIKVASCHDWEKRLRKNPNDFTETEKAQAQLFLTRVNPDQKLMEAIGPGFLERFLKGESTFLERLQCYIDDIVLQSDIVDYKRRLHVTKKRYPELSDEFFEKQKEFDDQTAREVFEKLPRPVREKIGEPQKIPHFIRLQIEERWSEQN